MIKNSKKNKACIVALIPARSESKSIKDKNIIVYKGKPLLAHSIISALKCKLVSKVIVSTDSLVYKKIAISYGAEVPFIRPKKISRDNSLDLNFIKHAYNFLLNSGMKIDLIVLLRPTSPNRKVDVLNNAIRTFLKKKTKYDSLRSVSHFNQPPEKMFIIKKKQLKGYFDKKYPGEYHSWPRQKFSKTYLPNGYIDILKPSFFKYRKNKIYGKMYPFLTEETLDIDYKDDLKKKF